MALEKTWQFDINRVHPQVGTALLTSQWQVWYIAEFLLGNIGGAATGLWTVYYSCDSVTAGTAGDTTDRWGAGTFAAAKMVRAANGSAHSWMVLKSPDFGGGDFYYLTVDFVGAANTNYMMILSKTAPTGGTTLTRPTSNTETTATANTGSIVLNDGVAAARHVHAGLTTDGKQFYMAMSKDGGGLFNFCVTSHYLSSTRANDDYRMVVLSDHSAAATILAMAPGLVSTTTFSTRRLSQGPSGNPNSTILFCVAPGYVFTGTNIFPFPTTVVATGDALDSTVFEYPLMLAFGSDIRFTSWNVKGRVPDFAVGPQTMIHGTTIPSVGTPELMLVGGMWFPTNATPSL